MTMAIVDTREMRKERHKLILEARKILDKADEEKRSLSAEDRQQYDKVFGDAEAERIKIEDIERRNNLEREEQAAKMRAEEEEERKKKDEEKNKETTSLSPLATEEYRSAFRAWLTKPRASINPAAVLTPEEHRALSAGTATEGGYLYADEQFVDQLIQDVTDETIVRKLASSMRLTSADTISFPVLDNRMAAAAWTSELGTPSRDTTLSFGRRDFTPHPLAKELPVSKVLLRKAPNVLRIVQQELARVVAEAAENAFMTGTGAGAKQPLGMFTASDDGISTSRDVSTGNTSSTPTCDGLKSAKYELKMPYWRRAAWIIHRDIAEKVALLKDGNGRYLWQDSVVQGEPDRLLNFPVYVSEFAPNTIAASAYVGILGDFREYLIVDGAVQIARAEELLLRSNEDLFVIRAETDGGPKKEEAFVRVKLGS